MSIKMIILKISYSFSIKSIANVKIFTVDNEWEKIEHYKHLSLKEIYRELELQIQ